MGFANKVPNSYPGCDAFASQWGVLVLGLTGSPSHRIVLATLSACLIVPQLAVRQVASVGTWLALYDSPRVMIAQMMRAVLLASAMAASRTGFRARRSINGEAFRAWVDQLLVPTLRPEDIVVMDNLGSHKGSEVRQMIRSAGARLWFLPAYSPDLNPIEQTFSKIKQAMRVRNNEQSMP